MAAAAADIPVDCVARQALLDGLGAAVAGARSQTAGTDVALGRTIEQAQAALTAIVDGVRVELAGAQQRFQQEGDLRAAQLQLVVDAAQVKFTSVGTQVAQVVTTAQDKFVNMETQMAEAVSALEARLGALEAGAALGGQRADLLFASSAPLPPSSSETPPAGMFDPWQDAAAVAAQLRHDGTVGVAGAVLPPGIPHFTAMPARPLAQPASASQQHQKWQQPHNFSPPDPKAQPGVPRGQP